MIKIIRFKILIITASLLLLLCHVTASRAQEIVVVKSAEIKPYNDAMEGFKRTCNCTVKELSVSEAEPGDIVRKILKINPDGVLAIGLDALMHVRAIKELPVVYTMAPYLPSDIPVRENISGVSMDISPAAYIDTMIAVFPNAKRIGLIYNPKKTEPFVVEALQAARLKGVEIISKISYASRDVPSFIDSLKDKIDVFWMLPDTTVVNPETVNYMLLFSFQNKVPIFAFSKKYVEMGALAALNIDPFDLGAQAGDIMRTLLYEKGVKVPIRVNARKTVMIINKKVADKLGVRIKHEILRKADVIY